VECKEPNSDSTYLTSSAHADFALGYEMEGLSLGSNILIFPLATPSARYMPLTYYTFKIFHPHYQGLSLQSNTSFHLAMVRRRRPDHLHIKGRADGQHERSAWVSCAFPHHRRCQCSARQWSPQRSLTPCGCALLPMAAA